MRQGRCDQGGGLQEELTSYWLLPTFFYSLKNVLPAVGTELVLRTPPCPSNAQHARCSGWHLQKSLNGCMGTGAG